jgi:LysM repeat protein
VRKGDTLWKISQANGTTVDELIKLNKLKKGADIKVGQTIQVPRKK